MKLKCIWPGEGQWKRWHLHHHHKYASSVIRRAQKSILILSSNTSANDQRNITPNNDDNNTPINPSLLSLDMAREIGDNNRAKGIYSAGRCFNDGLGEWRRWQQRRHKVVPISTVFNIFPTIMYRRPITSSARSILKFLWRTGGRHKRQ